MNVGVGLPTTTPGTTGELLLDWARRADEGPFSSLGVLDRVVYDSLEPFAALAAAAGVTSRVRLATMIAIGPLRPTGLLAKQAASVHALSGGRLTLGLAVGARTEDYEAAGVESRGRGRKLAEQLAYIRGGVDGDRIGPSRDGMEILVGGMSGQAFSRMARYADGYAHGGGPPRAFASAAARPRQRGRISAAGAAAPLGPGLLLLRRPRPRSRVSQGLLRVHGPVRRADRGGEPHERTGGQGLRAGLRRGGLRRARPLPHRRRPEELDRLAEALA